MIRNSGRAGEQRIRKERGRITSLHVIGCSKMASCKAPEIPRTEAYYGVRRRDEG